MRLPGFQGTHIPGDHRIVAPAPPQIIIPERKITSVEEAAKWHASRGGAVAEEEEEAVLLTDLVAGWALTGGPEQTLDSTGVIASGSHNLTAGFAGGGGAVTYSSDGALFDGANYLKRDYNAVFNAGVTNDFYISVLVKSINNIQGQILTKTQNDDEPYIDDYAIVKQPISKAANPYTYNTNLHITPGMDAATWYHIGAWFNHATGTIYGQLNAGDVQSDDGGANESNNSSPFVLGSYDNLEGGWYGYIKYVRIWIGENALSAAGYNEWLANMSGGVPLGRTDAEVAAYTGS